MTKVFDTSTLQGLKAAERFQQRAYSLYESISVRPIGLKSEWQISCSKPIVKSRNLGQHPQVVSDRQA